MFSITVLATAGCALFVIAAEPDWSRVNWGDAPTWVSALTTLAALLAAGWIVRIELARDEERRKERRAEKDTVERAEQADRIAVWVAKKASGWNVYSRNSSDLPVFDVTIKLWEDGGEPQESFHSLLPPDTSEKPLPDSFWIVHQDSERGKMLVSETRAARVRTSIKFQDAAGRIWFRNERGLLTKIGHA